MIPPPKVVALLTANRVTCPNNLFVIDGVYNVLRFDSFPGTKLLEVYLAMTNGRRSDEVVLRVVDGDLEEIASEKVDVGFADPLETQEVGVMTRVPFPGPGVYYVQVEWQGQVLFERRLTVKKVQARKEKA